MNVEFNENKPIDYNQVSSTGKVSSFFIKLGLAKDEASANKVMTVVAIICSALAIYIAF